VNVTAVKIGKVVGIIIVFVMKENWRTCLFRSVTRPDLTVLVQQGVTIQPVSIFKKRNVSSVSPVINMEIREKRLTLNLEKSIIPPAVW